MKIGKHHELVPHVPFSAPKVDGVPVQDPSWSQRVASGGWLPLRIKPADRRAAPARRQEVEVLRDTQSPVRLFGEPSGANAPDPRTGGSYAPVQSTGMRPPRARAPTSTRKANAAQHGAELAAFLRAREHQFSYDQSAYPDTGRWAAVQVLT